jgi:hypothetical protein
MLLDVKRAATTSSAQGVRLVVTLTEAGGTLRHLGCGVWAVSWMAIEKFSIWETFFGGVRIYNPKKREGVGGLS